MALYWFEMGNKSSSPWREKQAESQKAPSLNPYAKQQEKLSEQDIKIVYAHQLMKKHVITLFPHASLSEALGTFKDNKIRHAPVIDLNSKKILGIISDRDIMRKWAGIGDSFLEWVHQNNNAQLPISQCMSRKVLTAEADDTIIDIARAMFSEKVGCMPVVSKDNKVLGIITRTDILRLVVRTAPTHFWL